METMRILNKTAPASFNVEEKLEAGIVLHGSEVKALRLGHADLAGSYVKILGSEAYLVNAKVYPYEFARTEGYQEDRTRKLLLHKKEILALKSKLDQGSFTLVPLAVYESHGNFKVQIALARGKKAHERRRDAKRRAIERVVERELKNS
jgi:SsrA-binding protein